LKELLEGLMKSPHFIILQARAVGIKSRGQGQASPFPPFLPELFTCYVAAGQLAFLGFYQFPVLSGHGITLNSESVILSIDSRGDCPC
jgi:hypothetical protein